MYYRKTVCSLVIALCACAVAVRAETKGDERFTFIAASAPRTGLAEDLPLEEPFSVFRVRLDKNGVGEGRLAPASKVRSGKTIGVSIPDYDARPVLLTDFRTQQG